MPKYTPGIRPSDYVYQRLTDMGLEVQKPEGAFYMFINIKKYGMDSLTFCEKMLRPHRRPR